MLDAAWNLDGRPRCGECGVGVHLVDLLQGTHVCDPDDRLAHEAVLLAEQIELMHYEIAEYLQSDEGHRLSGFAQWSREHRR